MVAVSCVLSMCFYGATQPEREIGLDALGLCSYESCARIGALTISGHARRGRAWSALWVREPKGNAFGTRPVEDDASYRPPALALKARARRVGSQWCAMEDSRVFEDDEPLVGGNPGLKGKEVVDTYSCAFSIIAVTKVERVRRWPIVVLVTRANL